MPSLPSWQLCSKVQKHLPALGSRVRLFGLAKPEIKIYLPSCRPMTREDRARLCVAAVELVRCFGMCVCSAPVKPQCSNSAGPQLLRREHHKCVSFHIYDTPFMTSVSKYKWKQNPNQTQGWPLWTQQHISHWWQWWKDVGKYWCSSDSTKSHLILSLIIFFILSVHWYCQ